MAITYKDAGAGGGTETDSAQLALDCPATVDANDILIAHVNWIDNTSEPADPSGWTRLYPVSGLGAAMGTGTPVGRSYVYGKIAVGDEDGDTINFGTAGGTAGRFGRIYSFAGYSSGTISQVVRGFSDIPKEDDPALPTVSTSKAGGLAVALIAQDDNNAQAAGGAQTGGTWAEAVAEFVSTTLGAQGCACGIQRCTPTADPGTVTGGVLTTNTDESSTIGFEIRDAPIQTAVARISLASGGTPDVNTDHSIKVRARTTAGAGTIRAALYESTNNRSGDLESSALTTSLADYTLAISEANAANITSYSDLEIRLWGYADAGGAIVFEVDQLWLEIPEAGTAAYSLDCQPGSFTVTGTAATLAAAELFDAQPGSYTLTGVAATVVAGYALSCDPGSYAVTGTDATLLADRAVLADPGAYSVTGVAATLAAGLVFSSDPGVYTVTGTDASLVAGFAALADPGAFTVTGADADLVYVPVGAYTLDAQPGSFTVSGADAGLVYGALISIDAQPGTVAVTGTDATLAAGLVFNAEPGVFAVTGADATVIPGMVLSADPGSYAVTGANASTVVGRTLDAQPGSYAVAGFDADLVVAVPGVFVLDAQPGAYTVTGINATTIATRELPADPAAYTVTGIATTLFGEHNINAASGTFVASGADASIVADRLLDAQPGSYVFTGFAASVGSIFDFEIDAQPGNITVTGSAANLYFEPGLARLTTRGGRIRWNTTGRIHGHNSPGRITQTREGAVA